MKFNQCEQIWRNFAIFKNSASLWAFSRLKLVFGKNLNHLWGNYYPVGLIISIVMNDPYLKIIEPSGHTELNALTEQLSCPPPLQCDQIWQSFAPLTKFENVFGHF